MDSTTTVPFFVKPELTPERKDFYDRLATRNLAPLWEVFGALFPPQPTCVTRRQSEQPRIGFVKSWDQSTS